MESNKINFYVIANAALGPSLSGGDRIFIELSRRWAQRGHRVHVLVWEEGHEMCRRNKLNNVNFIVWSTSHYKRLGFALLYVARTLKGCLESLRFRDPGNGKSVIYSASDFWPDSLPALLMKRRMKTSKWVAGFYMFAPQPIGNQVYKGIDKIKGLAYFLSQKPIHWLIRRYADMVFVTNELDRTAFIGDRLGSSNVIAIRGGVDIDSSQKVPSPPEKKFDAVFVGRFHAQKGILELIDIWKYVVVRRKNARLAIIGDGELKREILREIARHGLERNVVLFGFKDGKEKIAIFKQSKMVLHPAIYDSGGMGPCEAMACGLPGISFDLPALRVYYPRGMLKVRCFNIQEFAESILLLLEDETLYRKLQAEAVHLAKDWDWNGLAESTVRLMKSLFL